MVSNGQSFLARSVTCSGLDGRDGGDGGGECHKIAMKHREMPCKMDKMAMKIMKHRENDGTMRFYRLLDHRSRCEAGNIWNCIPISDTHEMRKTEENNSSHQVTQKY